MSTAMAHDRYWIQQDPLGRWTIGQRDAAFLAFSSKSEALEAADTFARQFPDLEVIVVERTRGGQPLPRRFY